MNIDADTRAAAGVNVRYAEAGQDNAETVVLTSPWPESLFAFHKVWDRLAARFHLLAFDLPGFGKSEAREELFSPSAMGSFLVSLAREWELGSVHFVAPDVGTTAVLNLALEAPELVSSLVVGGGASAVPLEVGGVPKDIIAAPDMDGFRALDSRDLLGPTFDAMPGGPPPAQVREDYLESYAGPRFADSAAYVRSYPVELPRLAARLSSITAPVQVLHGRDDELVPTPNQEFLRDHLPNSRMDLVPAQHFAWEEVPDLYGDVLVAWLGGGYRQLSHHA